jgi:hypothetical protein
VVVVVIVSRFPEPPIRVINALNHLRVLRSGNLEAIAELDREPSPVPRPWDPASCDDELRYDVWTWCDNVVIWINHEYAWRGPASIPLCWPQHPYLAHEIALLACQRCIAGEYAGPELLEEWARNTFPMFAERMAARTGEGCRKEHTDWPGAPAFHRHVDDAIAEARRDLFREDTNQPTDHT